MWSGGKALLDKPSSWGKFSSWQRGGRACLGGVPKKLRGGRTVPSMKKGNAVQENPHLEMYEGNTLKRKKISSQKKKKKKKAALASFREAIHRRGGAILTSSLGKGGLFPRKFHQAKVLREGWVNWTVRSSRIPLNVLPPRGGCFWGQSLYYGGGGSYPLSVSQGISKGRGSVPGVKESRG